METGRQDRFLRYFLKQQDDIRAVIGSFVRDRMMAEDVFQDTALTLWQKFDEFDETRSFGAWARGIAVRKVLQRFGRNRRAPLAFAPETIEAMASVFDQVPDTSTEDEETLKSCLSQLPEKSRALVRMRYDESLSLSDIAERISSSLDAVNKALSRIRVALRACMDRKRAEACP